LTKLVSWAIISYMRTIKSIKFSKLHTFGFMNQGEYDLETRERIPEKSLFVYGKKFYGAVSKDDNQTYHGYTYGRYLIVTVWDRRLTQKENAAVTKWHVFKFDKPAHLLDNCEAFKGRLQGRFKTLTKVKEWFLEREK